MIHVRESEMVYRVLEILEPIALVRVEKEQASLTEVFLQLVKK